MKILRLLLQVSLFFVAFGISNGQTKPNNSHPLSKSILLSLEGGSNYSLTDYESTDLGLNIGGSLEYYFPTSSQSIFGLKLSLSQQIISGSDNNLGLPVDFETTLRRFGLGVNYSYAISEKILPFVSVGLSYGILDFLSEGKKSEFYDIENGGETNSVLYDLIGGVKFHMNEVFDINVGLGYHYLLNDNVDAIKYGEYEDMFISGQVGISYRIWNERDTDGDGVKDDLDKCPYEEEDIDGFQDEDGCPDYDNDDDGIIDIDDACQNIAEDLDGFQDEDGCPDPDNDGDGIEDKDDSCPNIAEDVDGFEDEDGCPDADNDGDGILDDIDKCVDKAEVFNGYLDDDGCPDTLPKPVYIEPKRDETILTKPKPPKPRRPVSNAPSELLIHSETTFAPNSSQIKSSSYAELNRIVAELKKYRNTNWRIEGHVDKQQSSSNAMRLTKSQADAILAYFVSKGLSAINFQSAGFGDSTPISSNTSVYGRMKNRRIIIRKLD